jgi:hypothetical protein
MSEAQACEVCSTPIPFVTRAPSDDKPEMIKIQSEDAWFGIVSDGETAGMVAVCSDVCLTVMMVGEEMGQAVVGGVVEQVERHRAEVKRTLDEIKTADTLPPGTEPSAV